MAADQDSAERLGRLLTDRRVHLSARYRNRKAFADATGLNWRLLHDVELAKRGNFKPETLRALEVAYQLEPGSFDRTLAGGPLEPLPQRTPQQGAPDQVPAWMPEVTPVARRLFRDDPAKQVLWSMTTEPEEVRSKLIEALDEIRGTSQGARGKPGQKGIALPVLNCALT